MESIYYEQSDVLHIKFLPERSVREVLQGHVYFRYAADGSVAELIIQQAKAHGIFQPRVKLPLAGAQAASRGQVHRWCLAAFDRLRGGRRPAD